MQFVVNDVKVFAMWSVEELPAVAFLLDLSKLQLLGRWSLQDTMLSKSMRCDWHG